LSEKRIGNKVQEDARLMELSVIYD